MPTNFPIAFPELASTEELVITDLANNGCGVGRMPDGRVVFVEGALPGERCTARIEARQRSHMRGRLLTLMEPSPLRVTPRCSVFSKCGGCQLQHVNPQEHLNLKTKWFLDALMRMGKWSHEHVQWAVKQLYTQGGQTWGYRQRVKLKWQQGALGFLEQRSHRICDVSAGCPVTAEPLQGLFLQIKEFLTRWEQRNDCTGKLQADILLSSGTQGVSLHLWGAQCTCKKPSARVLKELRSGLESLPQTGNGPFFSVPLEPEARPTDTHISHRAGFVQPHRDALGAYRRFMAQDLNRYFSKCAQVGFDFGPYFAWDLYSGSGAFSFLFQQVAQHFDATVHTTCVESSVCASQAFQCNQEAHDPLPQSGTVTFLLDDVGDFLKRYQALIHPPTPAPSLVISDPPRQGMGQGLTRDLGQFLAKQSFPVLLILVACDGVSFARDSQVLLSQGWQPWSLGLFDMFPMTVDYEVVGSFFWDGRQTAQGGLPHL